MQEKISEAISAANKACDDGEKEDCATAWDEVEELSAAASHKADATVSSCVKFWNEFVSTPCRDRDVMNVEIELWCACRRLRILSRSTARLRPTLMSAVFTRIKA